MSLITRNQKRDDFFNKIIQSVIFSSIFTFIIFLLIQIIVTDLIDDYILVQLDTPIFEREFDSITLINIIMTLNLIGLFVAFVISNLYIFQDFRAIITTLLSIIITLTLMFAISMIILSTIEGFYIYFRIVPLLPTLFMIFILRNPAIYLIIYAILLIALNTLFYIKLN